MHTEEKKNPNRAQKQLSNYKGRGKKKTVTKQPGNIQQNALSTYLSVTTLNVNKVNTTLKRHMVVEWIEKK